MGSSLAPGFPSPQGREGSLGSLGGVPRLEQSGKEASREDGPLLAGLPKGKLSAWSDRTSPLVRRLRAVAETGDWPSSVGRCPGRGPGS